MHVRGTLVAIAPCSNALELSATVGEAQFCSNVGFVGGSNGSMIDILLHGKSCEFSMHVLHAADMITLYNVSNKRHPEY
jgi:hypothetical protein